MTKMNPSVMDDVDSILNNKPAVKKRGQSVSERSAILAAAAATSVPAITGGLAGESSSITVAPTTTSPAASTVPSGPVQV